MQESLCTSGKGGAWWGGAATVTPPKVKNPAPLCVSDAPAFRHRELEQKIFKKEVVDHAEWLFRDPYQHRRWFLFCFRFLLLEWKVGAWGQQAPGTGTQHIQECREPQSSNVGTWKPWRARREATKAKEQHQRADGGSPRTDHVFADSLRIRALLFLLTDSFLIGLDTDFRVFIIQTNYLFVDYSPYVLDWRGGIHHPLTVLWSNKYHNFL